MSDSTPPTQEPICAPVAVGATLLTSVMRLLVSPWNFPPVGALALYSGARLPWWAGLAVPLGTMAVTDCLLYQMNCSTPFDPFVYASYAVIALIGLTLRHTESVWKIGSATVLSMVLFYLITNFGSWLQLSKGPEIAYSRDFAGLMQSYVAGLPFLRGTFLGDIIFVPVFFTAHAWLKREETVLASVEP